MQLAIIDGETVVNVVRVADDWTGANGEWVPPPGTEVVKDAVAGVGWSRVGEAFVPPPEGPLASYRELRKAAYVMELGAAPGDFVETIGDVLDDLIREVRALAAGPATPEFAALAGKIDDIKARFPKVVAADQGDPL